MSFCLSNFIHSSPKEMFQGALRAVRGLSHCEWELGGWLLAIERTRSCETAGFRSTVGYAMIRLGLEPQKAANLLRIMGALEGLPKLNAAFKSGEVGYGKIREITRVATAETEAAWLEFAISHNTEQVRQRVVCSPSAFERRVRSVRAQADLLLNSELQQESSQERPFSADLAQARPARSGGTAPGPTRSVGPVPDISTNPPHCPGSERGSGEAFADVLAEQSSAAGHDVPIKSALFPLEEDGLPSPRRIHLGVDFSPEEYAEWQATVERVSRQFGRRVSHKDVILELVRRHVASTGSASLERNPVVVRLEPDGTGLVQTDRGPLALSRQSAEDYLARANSVVVPDEADQIDSVLLLAGKNRKKPPTEVLRALIARSGGCCEQCGRRGVLHIHHIRPRSRGGTNALSNLSLRCPACHASAHKNDFAQGSPWKKARERRRRSAKARQAPSGRPRQRVGTDP